MYNKEKDVLADLFSWIQEGITDENLEEISLLSGFNFNTDNKKNILKKELIFFYLFTAHSYCKKQNLPSQLVNGLFNLVYDKNFRDENKDEWFKLLNKRIQEYVESYRSLQAGKIFGVVSFFQFLLRKNDNSYMPGFLGLEKLVKYFKNRIELLP